MQSTATPDYLSGMDPDMKADYNNLSLQDQVLFPELFGLEENFDLLNSEIPLQASISLAHYLSNINDYETQKKIIQSQLWQLDANAYNFGFFGTRFSDLIVSQDILQRLHFPVYTFDWIDTYDEINLDSKFALTGSMIDIAEDTYALRETQEIQNMSKFSADDFTSYIDDNGFPGYAWNMDYETVLDGIVQQEQVRDGAFIGWYNFHMNIYENNAAITGWQDTRTVDEFLPKELLDSVEFYIAVLDSCPQDWKQKITTYFEQYNEDRISRNMDELPYLIILGQIPEGEELLIPMGNIHRAYELAIYEQQRHIGSRRNYPMVSFNDWNNVITDKSEFGSGMSGNHKSYTLPDFYTPTGEHWNYETTVYILTEPTEVLDEDGEPTGRYMALTGLDYVTNLDVDIAKYSPIINIKK
jgi:hypothetical protein